MSKSADEPRDKSKDQAKPVNARNKPEALDPCAKPQASEAGRAADADEACDDGVQ